MPTLSELTTTLSLDAELRGNRDLNILDGKAIDKAGPDDITFAGDTANLRKVADCRAGAVIVNRSEAEQLPELQREVTLLLVDDAPAAFVEILAMLRPQRSRPEIGVAAGSHVDPTATIGRQTNIYPAATVGEGAVIGERCDIHAGVCVGPGCVIGDDVTLFSNVVLYPDVILGNHVRIHASAVIGSDGFGYRLVDGRHAKIPHFGIVRIGDHVEIGASTTIDRAMIGETVIGDGTKIDNQVLIAHNCELGRHNIIVGQVGFAGSATSGDYVVCAGQAGVSNQVHLGEGCVLGSRSAVNKDVPAGATYIGTPAAPAADAMKLAMAQKKVPQMRQSLRTLESQVEQLTARLDALADDGKTSAQPAA